METAATSPAARPDEEIARLSQLAEEAVRRCRAAGADQAEVRLSQSQGLNVSVRLGEVETLEHNRDRSLSITVYLGGRKANASTADLAPRSIAASIDQAIAIARHTEADPFAGLADAELMAREFPDFDLWHPADLPAGQAVVLARECEAAGRSADARISNSDGAQFSTGTGISVYANSHGFAGPEYGSHHSLSCSLIAGQGAGMQRDYWYSTDCRLTALEPPEQIGQRAAQRAVARLAPKPMPTGRCPVLFIPEAARGLIGHLIGAVSGGALYRRASFLLDSLGERLFPPWFQLTERPHLRHGHRSGAFDADGVATRDSDLIRAGVLCRYVLGSYSARKLGLQTTANAGGVHNLVVASGEHDFPGLLRQMGNGLVVTELMGQGVNPITGDYSRGAAGFRVQNGEIAHPVDEVTIAGNLREMFLRIEAVGNDVDPRSHILTGSILVSEMTIASGS